MEGLYLGRLGPSVLVYRVVRSVVSGARRATNVTMQVNTFRLGTKKPRTQSSEFTTLL